MAHVVARIHAVELVGFSLQCELVKRKTKRGICYELATSICTPASTGMNSRWQSGEHRVYMYSKGRPLNMYPQLCSLLFLDFWLFFLYYDGMKSFIHT